MNPITIADYDPAWPRHFEEIRGPIASVLDGKFSAIEHIGSTAVPGLAAKPIIDLDVLLKDANDFPTVALLLAPLGYQHQGDRGIAGREAFSIPANAFPHHFYVCMPGSDEFRRHVAFRDYLRAHPDTAAEYSALKRDLAARCGTDRDEYTRAKSHFVLDILARVFRKKE